jgi:hypothetical protein
MEPWRFFKNGLVALFIVKQTQAVISTPSVCVRGRASLIDLSFASFEVKKGLTREVTRLETDNLAIINT